MPRHLGDRLRAVIIIQNQLVLIKRVKPEQTYYVFPGGGGEKGENHVQTLERECKEELGVDVRVGGLFFRMEQKESDVAWDSYFYSCEVVSGNLGTGTGPEFQPNRGYVGTHEIVLVPLPELSRLDILPKEAKEAVLKNF